MIYSKIESIEYYLPEKTLSNDDLANLFSEWSSEKIEDKLGIVNRHIAKNTETVSELALHACEKLFANCACDRNEIDYVLFCTQSQDYFLPTTACIIQNKLNLKNTVGSLDINLGCSGFVYGLGLARGLIETQQASKVLLITAETYSKYLRNDDKTTRTLFGDGASATLIVASNEKNISDLVYGTDGSGAKNLIVTDGASVSGYSGTPFLYMNGPEIYFFTLQKVPEVVKSLLQKTNKTLDEIDWFVFHQASKHMLEALRDKIGIPKEKFILSLRETGNTVSSTIPIACRNSIDNGLIKSGNLVMLIGFGVGYSWGGCLVRF